MHIKIRKGRERIERNSRKREMSRREKQRVEEAKTK